jgi:hypothetical protein
MGSLRPSVTADHILFALSLCVIAMIAATIPRSAVDPLLTVDQDCALFYGTSGPEAERDCRANMLRSQLMRMPGGALIQGATGSSGHTGRRTLSKSSGV